VREGKALGGELRTQHRWKQLQDQTLIQRHDDVRAGSEDMGRIAAEPVALRDVARDR